MVQKIIVLGGGSAGFLAAISLKSRLPQVSVTVIRSSEIGIIGVGEGSTAGFTRFLHGYLKIPFKQFFDVAQPTWKLGLKFLWGPRPHFYYSFVNGQLDEMLPGLHKHNGYYCDEEMECEHPVSALMQYNKVFERLPNGKPALHLSVSYHFENEKLVHFLETYAQSVGVTTADDTVLRVRRDDNGVAGLVLKSERIESADLYVDCSGFASALLGKTMEEPFVDYKSTLACDRAVVGGWNRTDEPIKPYTTCETMTSGWCWQIEHETRINRGYVYSSAFISDDAAEREFRAANPKVEQTRLVRFVSGRRERAWVKNVVAIGNAYGFVEPLEATALGVIGVQSSLLADCLSDTDAQPAPSHRAQYNRHIGRFSDHVRAFLGVHYKFNIRMRSPFWDHCHHHTDLAGAEEIVEMYQDSGPTPLWAPSVVDSANQFGLAGYNAMLVGQKVPYRKTYQPTAHEIEIWQAARQRYRAIGQAGFDIPEALTTVRSPEWIWPVPRLGSR